MAPEKTSGSDRAKEPSKPTEKMDVNSPDWSDGLRKLYDSVVDEPLPDAFKDLLSKLDDSQTGNKD